MTLRFLKSTTALALAASLTLPVAAQQAEQAAPELSACAEAQDPEACRAAAEGAAAPEGLPAGEAVDGEATTPADALPDAAAQDAPDSESEAVEDLREMKDDAATRDEVQATPETPELEAPAADAEAAAGDPGRAATRRGSRARSDRRAARPRGGTGRRPHRSARAGNRRPRGRGCARGG